MKELITKIYVKFISILGNIQIYKYPLFFIYNPHHYLVNGNDYAEFTNNLVAGDIVLRVYKHNIIRNIIPGFYSHAGLYTGKNTIIHSVGEGVIETNLYDFSQCDGLAIVRPKVTKKDIKNAIQYAKNQLGKQYDYFFEFDNESTYSCTELVYWAYKDAISTEPQKISKLFGLIHKEIISPDAFLNDSKCELIWESKSINRDNRKLYE